MLVREGAAAAAGGDSEKYGDEFVGVAGIVRGAEGTLDNDGAPAEAEMADDDEKGCECGAGEDELAAAERLTPRLKLCFGRSRSGVGGMDTTGIPNDRGRTRGALRLSTTTPAPCGCSMGADAMAAPSGLR